MGFNTLRQQLSDASFQVLLVGLDTLSMLLYHHKTPESFLERRDMQTLTNLFYQSRKQPEF